MQNAEKIIKNNQKSWFSSISYNDYLKENKINPNFNPYKKSVLTIKIDVISKNNLEDLFYKTNLATIYFRDGNSPVK